jgi:hypothetical protein
MKWAILYKYRTPIEAGNRDFKVEVEAPTQVRAKVIGRNLVPKYYRPHVTIAEIKCLQDTQH